MSGKIPSYTRLHDGTVIQAIVEQQYPHATYVDPGLATI